MLVLPLAGYAAYFAFTWLRFGHPRLRRDNPLLDIFMPRCDVATNHSAQIGAHTSLCWEAIRHADLEASLLNRAIFRMRETILGSKRPESVKSTDLFSRMSDLGWGTLAVIPGSAIVMGAATKPWDPNPIFEPIPPDEFLAFDKPGCVKIAFSISAHSLSATTSIVVTETRAIATCPMSRRRFRNYWAVFSPGMAIIRRQLLAQVKRQATALHLHTATAPAPHTASATGTQTPNRAF
jgi:hypothetical protein